LATSNDDALLLGFGGHDDLGVQPRLLAQRAGVLGLLLGGFLRHTDRAVRFLGRGFAAVAGLLLHDLLVGAVGRLVGIGIGFRTHGFGIELGHVLTLVAIGAGFADLRIGHGRGHLLAFFLLGLGFADFRVGHGRGHSHALVALARGHAHLTEFFRVGHVHIGLVDGFGGGLAANGLDVAGFIVQIADVDVDQQQADLFQFDGHRLVDFAHECLSVTIDVLNLHGGDHGAHLANDDVLRLGLNLLGAEPEQANRGVLHDARVVRDGGGHGGRHADADVFLRQRVGEVDRHHKRFEIQIVVRLKERHDKRGAAMHALGRAAAGFAVDHKDLVRGTAFVATRQCDDGDQ